MTQSLEKRLRYHPMPQGVTRRGMRKVDKRLHAILEHVDVQDKSVLDLGCSGGYFSFGLSSRARHILAIDADGEVIKRNQETASHYSYPNIDFRYAKITPELIQGLPNFDVTLFLSVFHHMLTNSDAYDWNEFVTQREAFESLALIRARSKALVFEMGYPDEGFEWCKRLPVMYPTPRDWIVNNVFGSDFRDIHVIESPSYADVWGRIRRLAEPFRNETHIGARILKRLLAFDPRDGRDIFVGVK